MKLVPVLLPVAGIVIAGTWWWGGPSSAPTGAAPLRPPVSPTTPRAGIPTSSPALQTSGVVPQASEPSKAELAAESPPERDPCVETPAPRRSGPTGTQQLELRESDRSLNRLRVERSKSPGDESRELRLVQRLENGSGVFALEEDDRELPLDGPVTLSHANGGKASTGTMRNGKRVGLWMEWYAGGHKSSEGNWFHGTRHGFWSYWYENGQLREAGEYLYGRKEGLWTSWHENGEKERVAHYRNDRAEERTTIWHAGGNKAAEGQLEDDLREGFWLEWHENGALRSRGSYLHGRAEGRWEFWSEDGVLDPGSSGRYEAGRRVGD